MNYTQYKESRDLSWQLLIRHQVKALPVRVGDICRAAGIRVVSYRKAADLMAGMGLEADAKENDGFTYQGVIFYNQDCVIGRQRFTVAHELGHILLGHTGHLVNREPSPTDNPIETAANVFAARLLSPACVLWGLDIRTTAQIRDICDISNAAAGFRAARMAELYAREKLFLKEKGRSCFLQSPLEKQVYRQFEEFIRKNRL